MIPYCTSYCISSLLILDDLMLARTLKAALAKFDVDGNKKLDKAEFQEFARSV